MNRAGTWPAVMTVAFMSIPAHGAGFHQEGVHEHGTARVDIAIEGPALDIAFDAPAINVIGYEHAPRSPEEQNSLHKAEATFSQGLELFGLPQAARCALLSTVREPIAFEKDGDEDTLPGARHADFVVTYHFRCTRTDALAWIDVNLFPVLENAEKIVVSVVARHVQRQVELTPGRSTRVPLGSDSRSE